MNYIKKIKSLGFKKCEPLIVCEYPSTYLPIYKSEFVGGYFIEPVRSLLDCNDKDWRIHSIRFKIFKPDLGKIQTYKYLVSKDIVVYISTIRESKFLAFSENKSIPPKKSSYKNGKFENQSVHLTNNGHFKNFSESFWTDIISSLDKDIQRDIKLNQIC